MDRTTWILSAAVCGGVFTAAMCLASIGVKPAGPPLTPQEQAEMDALRHDPYDPKLTRAQKFRLLARRDLIRDYPLSVIDAAENDSVDGEDAYRVAVATPPVGFLTLDSQVGAQLACVAWRNDQGTVHETYSFKPGYVSHSGIASEIEWVRGGCAQAIATSGVLVGYRRVLQDLLDRIPNGDDYNDGRAAIRDRLSNPRPPLEGQRGVQYYE